MALTVPASLLGFIVKGDLDGVTIYTDRFGRKVFYQKAPPDKPPTDLQRFQRWRFAAAVQVWKTLTVAQRADYERATTILCLCATGLNLWIHLCMRPTLDGWHTVKTQTGLNLAQPYLL